MKHIITALTLLVPMTASAAPVDVESLDKAHSLALAVAYDQECEHLPDVVRRKLVFALDTIPAGESAVAMGHINSMVRRQGTDAFCGMFKKFMAEVAEGVK